jgi:hypothetical protein
MSDENVFGSPEEAEKSFASHIDPDPNCKKCKGTGSYMYDHNHGTICDLCCKHKSGYWLLTEHYANAGEWCCLDGCGTTYKDVAEELKKYRGKDF